VVPNLPLGTQIHDFNVHIDSNHVFWMVQVDDDAVQVDLDKGQASLIVNGLNVYDDHDLANSLTQGLGLNGDPDYPYPKIPGVASILANVSFDVEWSGMLDTAQIDNFEQQFQGSFLSVGATIYWSAEEDGFTFQSETPTPGRNLVSVLGREKNGVFFT
jgi:hypothetical protein